MAEHAFGPPCPGCTVEVISARIAAFPQVYTTCLPCMERGALYQARFGSPQEQEADRDQEDAQERARRESGGSDGKAHAQG